MKSDFSKASVIYIFGSCLTQKQIEALIEKLFYVQKSTKIITISYPLNQYSSHFSLLKSFPVTFPWGESTAYVQQVK